MLRMQNEARHLKHYLLSAFAQHIPLFLSVMLQLVHRRPSHPAYINTLRTGDADLRF